MTADRVMAFPGGAANPRPVSDDDIRRIRAVPIDPVGPMSTALR